MKKLLFVLSLSLLLLLVGCTKSFTVTFVTNNGEELESIVLEKGEFVELPSLTKEGHDFGGWFTDEGFTTSFEEENPIASDLTLYAKWDIKLFTVTFKNDDDSVLATRTAVPYGTAALAPADPTKVGYEFTGWDKAFDDVKSNLTVKAQFAILTYQVQFYTAEDEPLGEPQTIEHGGAATAPTDPVKEGYQFTGWDQSFTTVTSNLSIYATFERLEFTVEFQDSNGSRIGEVQTIFYGEDAIAPANPSKTGYTFESWNNAYTNVTQNLIVRAVYTAIEYTISYYDGTNLLTHSPNVYTIDSTFNLVNFNKTGYLFMGWYEDSAFTTKVTSIQQGNTGAVVFYGKWLDESLKFNLNYELNGGSWTWSTGTVGVPGNGIDAYSNLPEQLMADFYYYLKNNNLLASSTVATKLQKTTWETFKSNYTDPVAIYNHTSTNTSSTTDGYSQYFYSSAMGDAIALRTLTITGGFFGTEPYKTKYANLITHLTKLMSLKGYNTQLWEGPAAKSLTGFVLDGYFYGTQGAGTGDFTKLRAQIPNTNLEIVLTSGTISELTTTYSIGSYIQGLSARLVAPVKDGYVFAGWYDNVSLTGDVIWEIVEGVTPASMYYAKWIAYTELD